MKIRKFVAADMRDALAQVKRELGGDAMIVASRPVRRGLLGNGIEVTAAVDIDEGAPTGPTAPPPHTLSESDLERIMAPLKTELRGLRAQIRANDSHGGDEVLSELREVRRALGLMHQEHVGDLPSLASLATQHKLVAPSEARVVALVGPTGVGKTTTIAKLAARAALVERRSVVILTLDGYRIGGEEQMRIFADLIGAPLVVTEPQHLRDSLSRLGQYDRVFVDTAGRSPRDTSAADELARAFVGIEAEVHLTLPACWSSGAIDACATRLAQLPIARLLFTKIDEVEGTLDELVRAPARLGHPVSWLSTGQRVPEDIEAATSQRLVDLALFGLTSTSMEAAA